MSAIDENKAMLDLFERAAMAYERLGKTTRDDEKTRSLRKEAIAELAGARSTILAALAPQQAAPMPGVTARMLPAVEVHDVDTLPSGTDHLVAIANVHEGCVIALQGTNGKMIGWIDTHAWTKGRVYRDQLLPPSEAGTSEREPVADGMGEFKPCIVVNEDAGVTEAVFEDVAYIAEPVFHGVHHWIDKHIAIDDGRLVGMTVWKTSPAPAQAPVDGEAVLVPRHPTPEMLGAWYRYKSGHHFLDETAPADTSDVGAYAAMLAAAPSARKEP